ncbi:MAG: cytochrome-c peroxidase [Moraxellaceae bacterium]|nr:MAG: cytochrome-c peroxidase [Moraxellaceae bacterium]
MRRIIALAYFTSIGILAACSSGSSDFVQDTEDDLVSVIQQLSFMVDPSVDRDLPSQDDPVVQLGKLLFFSQGLSGDGETDEFDTACASCHHPAFAGSDELSLPYGVGAEDPKLVGPGREFTGIQDSPVIGRNSISVMNVGLWDHALNHDGSVESLNPTMLSNGTNGGISTPDSGYQTADDNAGDNLVMAQTRLALTNTHMMRNHLEEGEDTEVVLSHLIERLKGNNDELEINQWLEQFRTAFDNPDGSADELITEANLITALAEYQRSMVFVFSPWRDYLLGDLDAISTDAKRGATLVLTSVDQGGLGCVSCHSGDFFTDEQYHTLAIPQIGPGMGDDNGESSTDDFGRFRVTGDEADRYAFRTPTLLNVVRTGPWGHNGAYTTLESIITHHLYPRGSVEAYDTSQVNPEISAIDFEEKTELALAVLETQVSNAETPLEVIVTGEFEILLVIEFLKTLTDYRLIKIEESTRHIDCVAPLIPDSGDENPDALRLNAEDSNGISLLGNFNGCSD